MQVAAPSHASAVTREWTLRCAALRCAALRCAALRWTAANEVPHSATCVRVRALAGVILPLSAAHPTCRVPPALPASPCLNRCASSAYLLRASSTSRSLMSSPLTYLICIGIHKVRSVVQEQRPSYLYLAHHAQITACFNHTIQRFRHSHRVSMRWLQQWGEGQVLHCSNSTRAQLPSSAALPDTPWSVAALSTHKYAYQGPGCASLHGLRLGVTV